MSGEFSVGDVVTITIRCRQCGRNTRVDGRPCAFQVNARVTAIVYTSGLQVQPLSRPCNHTNMGLRMIQARRAVPVSAIDLLAELT